MKIQIDGIGTVNKGAELMLYATLEQIERKYPEAIVICNTPTRLKNIITSVNVRQPLRFKIGKYPIAIINRLHLFQFTKYFPPRSLDLLLDASGFRLGDQWASSTAEIVSLEKYYRKLKAKGTKIILLPQAFGPFKTKAGKHSVDIINKYADLIIARDSVSKKYLLDAGGVPDKIRQFTDFTALLKGILPKKYYTIKDAVCIIPNKKMISHTSLNSKNYIDFLVIIIKHLKNQGHKVFLLNHEGDKDLQICKLINKQFDNSLTIVTDLNAKETKGVIGASHLVISSRYHGVASALNQGVPCLATSWSHKYELLFQDFGLTEHILNIEQDSKALKQKIDWLTESETHLKISNHLTKKAGEIKNETKKMWEVVWEKSDL